MIDHSVLIGYDSSKDHAEGFPECSMQQPRDHCTDSAEDGHPVYVGGRFSTVVWGLGKSENVSGLISANFRAKMQTLRADGLFLTRP